MTKARKYFGALALISGATLSLVACGNNKHTNSSNANKTNHKFSETVPVKSIKKGGTLTYALETDSPFTVFSYQNYQILQLIVRYKAQV